MTTAYLKYELNDSYIDNWLVAGPLILPDKDAPPEFSDWQTPVENAKCHIGEHELTWNYYCCQDDHLVDFSDYLDTELTVLWAYTRLVVDTNCTAAFTLTCPQYFKFHINGELITEYLGGDELNINRERSNPITLSLKGGVNELVVCAFDFLSTNDGLYFTLQWSNAPGTAYLQIPTAAPHPERREKFERVLHQAYLDRDVYARGEEVIVRWPPQTERTNVMGRMQHESGRIYAESQKMLDSETHTLSLTKVFNVPDGRYDARLMPPGEEFYNGLRYDRRLPFYVSTGTYSTTLYGTDEQRRTEALEFAATQTGLYAEIAKMALERWDTVQWLVVEDAIVETNRIPKDSSSVFLGLRRILNQFDDHAPEKTRTLLLTWAENNPEPLSDTENLRQLHQRGTSTVGIGSWSDPLHELAIRLTYLADFGKSTELCELAAVSLDKAFFSLAINSFQGTLSAPRHVENASEIINGHLAPSAGISRMLWGMGTYNEHIAVMVSLACSDYEVPSIIQAIALDQPETMWSRQKSQSSAIATFKTPDYLLTCAPDFSPGQHGSEQHLWQATLSPDALVFTNHPARSRDTIAPGFWCGNAVLPRIGQWHDVLIAIYNAEENSGLNYTHAYFPIWAFDEHVIEDNWAFARVNDGYLALKSANDMRLITSGDSAYRELRVAGRQNIWLCHMGSARQDGSFVEFQDRIKQLDIKITGLSIELTTLRGDSLQSSWDRPLSVNGVEQRVEDFKLCENPYCVADVGDEIQDIQYQDYVMRLNFSIE